MFACIADDAREQFQFQNTAFHIDLSLASNLYGRIISYSYPNDTKVNSSIKFINIPNLFWFRINVDVKRNGGHCRSSPIQIFLSGTSSDQVTWAASGCGAEASKFMYDTIFTKQNPQQYLTLKTGRSGDEQIPAFEIKYDGESILIKP